MSSGGSSEEDDGLYACGPECPQGAVHDPSGCEGCHDPDCPHLIDFGTWLTSYCERCAREMRRSGHRISDKGAPLAEDQLQLELPPAVQGDSGSPT